MTNIKRPSREKVIMTASTMHCGGKCLLKVHVKDGVVVRIETPDSEDPQFRPCLRCRAFRQFVYHPERLKWPLRRVGKRGEGKFERISWDVALDTVAGELKRVKESYGAASRLCFFSGGDMSRLNSGPLIEQLLAQDGGFTGTWGSMSYEGALFAIFASYGDFFTWSGRDNLPASKLIILWAMNPVATIHDTGTNWHLLRAKESGARIVAIDPRFTNTAATLADEWIPIKPGTDAAMLVAMAHVIIRDNLQDRAFIDRYTVGFEHYKHYVMGEEDGIPKSPAWAEAITGVSATVIENLAREYATQKPAALIDGIAAGRSAYGEQYHRAAIILAALTGNIGIHGGNSPGRSWAARAGGYPYKFGSPFPKVTNPVDQGVPPRPYALGGYYETRRPGHTSSTRLNRFLMADAILKGKAGGYPHDYKLLFLMAANYLNQLPDINKVAEALHKLEFIVAGEQFMTPTAKFADIIFPITTYLEHDDITDGSIGIPAYMYSKKVIEPVGECKSYFEICVELAKRLGVNFTDKTEEECIRQMIEGGSEVPDYKALRRDGIYKIPLTEPYIAFKSEITDPGKHPFGTPSGKIEIYSQQLADMNHPQIPPVPQYIEPWEGPNDPLRKKFPLQLVTTHALRRAHSMFERVGWLREVEAQVVLINVGDAHARGIEDGDSVKVFNARGKLVIPARVTEGIMPGVVSIQEGAWYDPDEDGIDRGGNPNVLTKDGISPGGAFTSNTALVQVEKS